MITRASLVRRLILGSLVGGCLTAFLVIGLAGFGRMPPQPALGVMGFAFGTFTWVTIVWRRARQNR